MSSKAHCCVHLHYLSSLLYISLSMPLWAPYQDSFCLLSCCGGCSFLRLVHPIFPSPLIPNVLQCPWATAMEICFSHTANYLRVVTSLTVPGVNEWLIGRKKHSSHGCGNLVFSNFLIHSAFFCYLFDWLCSCWFVRAVFLPGGSLYVHLPGGKWKHHQWLWGRKCGFESMVSVSVDNDLRSLQVQRNFVVT